MFTNKMRRLLTFLISILLLNLIAFQSIGVAVAQIRYFVLAVVALGSLIWLIALARSKCTLKIPRFAIPIAILIAYQLILIPVSPVPFYGFEMALQGIFYFVIMCFFIYSLQGAWEIDTWENALIGTAILFSLVDIVEIALWLRDWKAISGSLLPLPPFGFRSGGSFLGHPNRMASFINLALPLVITRVYLAKGNAKKAAWGLLILFFVIIEYFASSRGAWLGAIAGIGLMILLMNLKSLSQRTTLWDRIKGSLSSKNVIRLSGILVIGIVLGIIFLRQVQVTPGHSPGGSGRFDIWANAFRVFLSSPIWGNGPSSMQVLYAVEAGVPPGFAASHAHNAFLQIAGELGIIGLALVFWCALLLLRTFFRTWTSAPASTLPILAGYAAIFTAAGVEQLFQYAFDLPIYTAGIFLLLTLFSHYAPAKEKLPVKTEQAALVLSVLLLIYFLGNLFTLRGSTEFQKGMDAANESQWSLARDHICNAYETNPSISHYAFQCGLAQAQVAYLTNDTDALSSALLAYEEGLRMDPYWPIHRANLSALKWTSGEANVAMELMSQALESAPRNATLALNLGWMEEQQGETQQAISHYQLALSLDPALEESIFFTRPDPRRKALAAFVPEVNPASSYSLAWAGKRALNEGNLTDAENFLTKSLSINANQAIAYAWLGQLYSDRNDIEQAWYYTQLALFLDGNSPIVRVEASRIAQAMGDEEAWMNHLLQAYELLQSENQSFEFESVFYMRPLLAFDLVPQMVDPKLSLSTLEEFKELASELKTQGKSYVATEILGWLETQENN
jgi:putative inorganic carbon (HCO3(-)) transporter